MYYLKFDVNQNSLRFGTHSQSWCSQRWLLLFLLVSTLELVHTHFYNQTCLTLLIQTKQYSCSFYWYATKTCLYKNIVCWGVQTHLISSTDIYFKIKNIEKTTILSLKRLLCDIFMLLFCNCIIKKVLQRQTE